MTSARSPANSNDPRVRAALAEYFERVDKGERVAPEAFIARHPEIADELRSILAMSEELAHLGGHSPKNDPPRRVAEKATQSVMEKSQRTMPSQSSGSPSESTAGLPDQFGRYRVIRALGGGAMGTVYLAEDTQLDRQVALKTPTFDKDDSGELLERFYREAKAAAKIRHPNICPVYDVGAIDGRHYISMAFIAGKPLASFIRPEKPQSERQCLMCVRKLALGLNEAHSHGIVHRDLKPANVMMDEKGEPIITDFGLASMSQRGDQSRLTQSGMILGSPAYMSPEQIDGEPDRITPATDQYALGVILYELLTGALPFRGTITQIINAIVNKTPTPPSELRPELDPRIESLCLKMMAKSPADRFPSVKAAADQMAVVLKDLPSRSGTETGAAVRTDARGTRPDPTPLPSRTLAEPSVVPEESASRAMKAARQCMAQHEYEQAVRMLEQIPEARRTEQIQALLLKARQLAREVKFLLEEIDRASAASNQAVALQKAEALDAIAPGHPRVGAVRAGGDGIPVFGSSTPRTKPRPRGASKHDIPRPALIAGGAALLFLLAVVLIFRAGKAVVRVEINDPSLQVVLHGKSIEVKGGKEDVRVDPGDGTLVVRVGDVEFTTSKFTLKKGGNPALVITRLEDRLAAKFGDDTLGDWDIAGADVGGVVRVPSEAVEFQGHAYQFIAEQLDWSQAKKRCEELGGHLPIVRSREQNEFLTELARKNFATKTGSEAVWLGASDAQKEGDWKWVDGSPMSYKNWAPTQPTNRSTTNDPEHYALLWLSNARNMSAGVWNDQPDKSVEHIVHLICEWDSAPGAAMTGAAPRPAAIPFTAEEAKSMQEAWAGHLKLPVEYQNAQGLRFRLIPPGEFQMGSPPGEIDPQQGELPQRSVSIDTAYYLCATEVTVAQFRAFVDEEKVTTEAEQGSGSWGYQPARGRFERIPGSTWKSPGYPQADAHPVTCINWSEAVRYCGWLSRKEGLSYRLPTEAEWEFACRAGTTTRFPSGDAHSSVRGSGNVADRALKRVWPGYPDVSPYGPAEAWDDGYNFTSPVNAFPSNPFGLYGMIGNVREFCSMNTPVFRGGSFSNPASEQRSAIRVSNRSLPDYAVGFRVVLEVDSKSVKKLAVSSSTAGASRPKGPGWIDLFNGRDLTGWKQYGASGTWKVENGVLQGSGGKNRLLYADRKFGDVHLQAECRLAPGSNSGLCLRCEPVENQLDGCEAQLAQAGSIGTGPNSRFSTGSIWALAPFSKRVVDDNTWFTIDFIAEERNLTVKINGETTAMATMPASIPASGLVGLSQFTDAEMVQFRRVSARPLDASNAAAAAIVGKPAARVPDARPGSALRFLGVALFDPPSLAGIADDVNVIIDRAWQEQGDKLAEEARKRGAVLIAAFNRSDFPAIEPKLIEYVRKNRDVVAGVCFHSPYNAQGGFTPDELGAFGRRMKEQFPGLSFWVSYIEMPAGMNEPLPAVPPEVDVVDVSVWFDMTPQQVTTKVDRFIGAWKSRAGTRPVVLRWPTRPSPNWKKGGAPFRPDPGTIRACGDLIEKHKLAGLIVDQYGPRADDYSPPLEHSATALTEFRELSRKHGVMRTLKAPNAAPVGAGWKSLFDGTTLAGWKPIGSNQHWTVTNSAIVGRASPGALRWLASEKTYSDFELEFEYRLPQGGNSGVYLRVAGNTDVPAPEEAIEIQLIDDDGTQYLRPNQRTGAIYGSIAPTTPIKPAVDQWQQMTIRAEGPRITVSFEGQKILDADLNQYPTITAERPSLRRTAGYLGFQGHRSIVEFRRIRIRELPG